MATKRRRRANPAKRRRRNPMASVRRVGGKSISQRAFHRTGLRRNPKRRGRRRNPGMGGGIIGQSLQLVKSTVAVMAGQTLGRTVMNAIPLSSPDPKTNALYSVGKGLLVAIALKKFGTKVVSADLANLLAIGALQNPLRDAITAFVPQAASVLSGGYAFPSFPSMASYARMGSYADDGNGDEAGMGSYAEVYQQ